MNTEALKKARAAYRERQDMGQIRIEKPKAVIEAWKSRAATQGKSLTGYITELIEADIAKSKP